MAEPVFRIIEILVKAAVAATGARITFLGQENIPQHGGAVVAMNHTSYLDWIPAAYAAVNRGRRLRFLIKAELQHVRSINFVIKHVKLIPVDRNAGADAYAIAVQRLREENSSACIQRAPSAAVSSCGSSRVARPGWLTKPTCRSFRS
ncbi:hypothetical protein MBOT_00410 [Mycobacterium botniense]|uniref:Phospholipid/glycerol acyltransferase domain-containing protein n=1 Tax=Mycobacterium botniense TaxID=84962 RepID=A0A7I9XTI9_9MYCO|nr:hypothetical protein MBOT_00410 [Mycobacterium botniense]